MKKKPDLSGSHPSAPRIARIYIRQSDSGGRGSDEDNLSPLLQLEEGRPYCPLHGLVLDEEASLRHADVDQRAFRRPWRKRPGLVGHYQDAKAGLFTDLIVYKLSRLVRNAREGLELFAEFEALGVAIHVVKEGIDSSTATGRLLRTIMLGVAEMESENTSQFISDAIRARHSQGKPWNQPYWINHAVERDAKGKMLSSAYVLTEPQSTGMRRLVQLRQEGRNYTDIARILNAEGFPAARGTWTARGTRHYLLPPCIDMMEGHSPGGRHLSRLENVWPRLLSESEAEAIRQVQRAHDAAGTRTYPDGRAGNGRSRGRSAGSSFLLSSLTHCGDCGEKMRGVNASGGKQKTNRVRIYLCDPKEDHRASLHKLKGGGLYVSGVMLEDAVARVVRLALDNPPAPPPARKTREKAAGASGPKVKDPAGALVALTKQLDTLVRMRMEERIDDGEYDRLRADLLKRRETLQEILMGNPAQQGEARSVYQNTAAMFARMGDSGGGSGAEGDEDSVNSSDTTGAISRAWREIFLQVVDRVDVKPTVPDIIAAREPTNTRGNARNWARITLRYPCALGGVFWAPLYTRSFKGERTVYSEL
ncbi:MAG: recombinase family protein [Armatimonadota bacterium]